MTQKIHDYNNDYNIDYILKRVLIICLLDLFGLTRFSSKRQSFLLTRFLNMLTRYAKLVYKFYLANTVDFLIYFYACNFKRIYAFELHTFFDTKMTWLNTD